MPESLSQRSEPVSRVEALALARKYETVANMKPNSISNREAYEVYGAMWTTKEAFRLARANLGAGVVCGALLALCCDALVRLLG